MTVEQNERAMRAYVEAMGAADPIRLRFLDERGLTLSQLRLMYLIREYIEPSVGDLAAEIGVRPPTLTGAVTRLVQRDLVGREHDPEDRRIVRLRLTAQGRRMLDEFSVAGRAYLESVFAALGEDRVAALTESFEQFADAARAVMREAEETF